MKNKYSKPLVNFEDFSMNGSIAASCEAMVNNPSENVCGVDMGGLMAFSDNISGCTDIKIKAIDEGKNTPCYHVPIETYNMFNS